MAGPKPVRPLSTKGSLEKSSDAKQSKKKASKKPSNPIKNEGDESAKKDNVKPVHTVKDSVVVKLKPSQIEDAVTAFSKLLKLNSAEAEEKSLFSTEGQKVSLQISGIKLPRETESQAIKMKLPHSPLPGNKDVCLFVKDLEKGLKVDHEGSVQHFTNLLADKGVQGITKVISLRELKVEYKQFEAKTQLCHMFDQFLADDRIIRLLPQFLGKPFYKRKKMPIQVNLSAKDLPGEFAKCLNTTILPLKNMGSCSMVTVGMSTLTTTQLIENTTAVIKKLEDKYPGGWINIRSIHINSGSTSIPLYASFRSTAEVGLVRGGKKPSRAVVVDELSTVVGGTVVVTPFGTVKVKRKADPEWTENDDTLKELVQDEKRQSKGEEEEDADTENNQEEKVKEKGTKVKKQKKKTEEEESEDEMEDKEMEYMKKVADEEEEMEKQLEDNEKKLSSKLKAEEEEDEESEEEVDDDAETENLLSEGESSDSDEEELIMKNKVEDDEEEEEEAPIKKKKSKKLDKSKKKAAKSSSGDQLPQKKLKKDKKKDKKKKVKGDKN